MVELRLSVAALRDLRQIRADGIRDFGAAASDAHMLGLERLFGLLRRNPLAGQRRFEFAQPVRSLSLRPHRILYRVEDDKVSIDRIIHQARDVPRTFRKDQ